MKTWIRQSYHPQLTHSCCCCCSVIQSCLTLHNPMDCSTLGLPVPHHLPEFAQVHVHWISDAIQPSHLLSTLFFFCFQSFPPSGSFPMSQLLLLKHVCLGFFLIWVCPVCSFLTHRSLGKEFGLWLTELGWGEVGVQVHPHLVESKSLKCNKMSNVHENS